MRALLIATGWVDKMSAILAYRPTPLLNILDKPVLFHIFDSLRERGVTHCDLLLYHLPQEVRKRVGDGERFGLTVDFHLTNDPQFPLKSLIPIMKGWNDSVILMGHCDQFPYFDGELPSQVLETPKLIRYPSKHWTGWGYFPVSDLVNLPSDIPYLTIPNQIKKHMVSIPGQKLLSVCSYSDLKQSSIRALSAKKKALHLPTTAFEHKPGIWSSRGVYIHPRASLTAPIFIGENSYIEEGARLGPETVIENNCLIDKNSQIAHTIVCRNSYIGKALTLNQAVVDRSLLVNVEFGTELTIIEDFILSELRVKSLADYLKIGLEKLAALLFLLLFSPIILILWPLSRVKKKEVVAIPTQYFPYSTPTFFLLEWELKSKKRCPLFPHFFSKIPQAINVLKGNLHIVGLPPRTMGEVKALPEMWRTLYLNGKAGVISLKEVELTQESTDDDHYASDMYQTINRGLWFQLQLIFRWIFQTG